MKKLICLILSLFGLVVFVLIAEVQAQTIYLPKTGQKMSYGSGDDGDLEMGISWPVPRFTDNGDGTITDNLTGLMWLKDANCMVTVDKDFDKDGTLGDGKVTWPHALEFVQKINSGYYPKCSGGYND